MKTNQVKGRVAAFVSPLVSSDSFGLFLWRPLSGVRSRLMEGFDFEELEGALLLEDEDDAREPGSLVDLVASTNRANPANTKKVLMPIATIRKDSDHS